MLFGSFSMRSKSLAKRKSTFKNENFFFKNLVKSSEKQLVERFSQYFLTVYWWQTWVGLIKWLQFNHNYWYSFKFFRYITITLCWNRQTIITISLLLNVQLITNRYRKVTFQYILNLVHFQNTSMVCMLNMKWVKIWALILLTNCVDNH